MAPLHMNTFACLHLHTHGRVASSLLSITMIPQGANNVFNKPEALIGHSLPWCGWLGRHETKISEIILPNSFRGTE